MFLFVTIRRGRLSSLRGCSDQIGKNDKFHAQIAQATMMSSEDEHKVAAPSQPSIMNYSNAGFDQFPGKVERSRDDPQVGMAPANLKAPPVKKPGSPSTLQASADAASALTSLKPVVNTGEEYVPDYDPDCDFQIPLRFTKSGRRRATPFPMKVRVCLWPRLIVAVHDIFRCSCHLHSLNLLQLMKVLCTRRFNHIISWTPDGTGFVILRPKAFSTDILPYYFKEAKFSSFTRKLHRWGFQRNVRGPDSGSYWHKNFQRGRLDLLDLMSCYKPREASARAAGKIPKPRKPRADSASSQDQSCQAHVREQQPHMMPTAELIAEAQAIRARAQQAQMMSPTASLGGLTEERLNAAIEMEVARRLRERIDAASYSRLATMHQGSPPPPHESMGMLQQQQNLPARASYETMGMQQQNIPAQGYAQAASSPGRFSSHGGAGASGGGGGGMSPYEREMNARLQQYLVHTGSSGYDDQQRFPQRYDGQQQQHQQYFDPNMDSMGRGST
jgi:hypothetical protein